MSNTEINIIRNATLEDVPTEHVPDTVPPVSSEQHSFSEHHPIDQDYGPDHEDITVSSQPGAEPEPVSDGELTIGVGDVVVMEALEGTPARTRVHFLLDIVHHEDLIVYSQPQGVYACFATEFYHGDLYETRGSTTIFKGALLD
jgi:hypothetical protein